MRNLQLADKPFDINSLKIATPCDEDWSAMAGDERKRFCDACSLHVFNVEEMSTAEVEALVGIEERVCLHLWRRRDGTVITRDCPVGLAERAWRGARNTALITAASALSVVAFVIAGLVGWSRSEVKVVTKIEDVQQSLMDEVEVSIDGGI